MWLCKIFPDAITTWTAIGAIATFGAIFFALFGEKIKSKIWGAKLIIYHENKLPYNKLAVVEVPTHKKPTGFFIRLKIENIGGSTAHGVYTKLTKIEYVKDSSAIETYDPTVLKWVGTQKWDPQSLSPKDYDFVDLIFTMENNPRFSVQTDSLLRGSPSAFEIDLNPHFLYISLYSDDAPTVIKKYQLTFDDDNSFDSAKITEV